MNGLIAFHQSDSFGALKYDPLKIFAFYIRTMYLGLFLLQLYLNNDYIILHKLTITT